MRPAACGTGVARNGAGLAAQGRGTPESRPLTWCFPLERATGIEPA